MPRGFSFEASLTMPAGSRPNSRASSSMGLPAWYGAIALMWAGAINGLIADVMGCAHARKLLCRVRAQHLDEGHLTLQVGQGAGDVGIIAMAQHVDVEIVFPLPGAGGARLETGHRDAVGRQRGKHVVDGARAVGHGQDQAGLVL